MLIRGDARRIPLRDASVDCVVTSPPYFGLRDYGHEGQIGLEPTPEAYVASLVAVFAEVKRVLKPEGSVWVNLGDSYAAGGSGGYGPASTLAGYTSENTKHRQAYATVIARKPTGSHKPKDLLGIPWAVAFALRDDGWYLRSDVIWAKPNPMPESVTDRPTKAHEYLFLLTKSEKYFYDSAAIAEPVSDAMLKQLADGYDGLGLKDYASAGVQNPSSVKQRIIANARQKSPHMEGTPRNDGERWRICDGGVAPRGLGRNKRTVWTIPTMPYEGAHFATMPEKLVEPCILAGCPLGGLVLDPFCGTFTVGAVAARLGRRAVGVDLSYQDLARRRTAQRGFVFVDLHADESRTPNGAREDERIASAAPGSPDRRSAYPGHDDAEEFPPAVGHE